MARARRKEKKSLSKKKKKLLKGKLDSMDVEDTVESVISYTRVPPKQTRGQILQRHKLEAKQLKSEIASIRLKM